MSLYNLLFGTNQLAPLLKIILELDQKKLPKDVELPKSDYWNENYGEDSEQGKLFVQTCIDHEIWPTGRFRDIYVSKSKIVLYTRNGGGNRPEYWWVFEILSHHPNYLTDYDDDFDSTYAHIEFSIPDEFQALLEGLESELPREKWKSLLSDLESKKDTPRVRRAIEVTKPILEEITKAIEEKQEEEHGEEGKQDGYL